MYLLIDLSRHDLSLNNALLGDDDLDILVNPTDKEKLYTVFSELNIIRGFSDKDSWQKGVFHYYGLDFDTSQIIHIHLHFQLPIGFDYNKNYIIPICNSIFIFLDFAGREMFKSPFDFDSGSYPKSRLAHT